MKGIVLAGGSGSRLAPLTRVTNKHLLHVYDKPMVFYPIQTLVDAGMTEIIVLTGGEFAGEFLQLLGNGKDFGLEHIHYAYQEGSGGIAQALGLCRSFVGDDPMCVILGDNIIEGSIKNGVDEYTAAGSEGAMVFLKEVHDPERFGVAELEAQRIVNIVEKPTEPKSNLAVTGFYIYDRQVWDVIDSLEPSARGELEITDVNNYYVKKDQMRHMTLEGWWTDAGTFNSLLRANALVAKKHDVDVNAL
jgi:glucose-1-phosphate thymidylyltransferase